MIRKLIKRLFTKQKPKKSLYERLNPDPNSPYRKRALDVEEEDSEKAIKTIASIRRQA